MVQAIQKIEIFFSNLVQFFFSKNGYYQNTSIRNKRDVKAMTLETNKTVKTIYETGTCKVARIK